MRLIYLKAENYRSWKGRGFEPLSRRDGWLIHVAIGDDPIGWPAWLSSPLLMREARREGGWVLAVPVPEVGNLARSVPL